MQAAYLTLNTYTSGLGFEFFLARQSDIHFLIVNLLVAGDK